MSKTFIVMTGGAVYDWSCSVILPSGVVATYVDENGSVHPVMNHFSLGSARNAEGEIDMSTEKCLRVKIGKGLFQGKNQLPAVIDATAGLVEEIRPGL